MNRKDLLIANEMTASPTPSGRDMTESLPEPKKERSHRGSQTSSQGTLLAKIYGSSSTLVEEPKPVGSAEKTSSSNNESQKTNDLGSKCSKCGARRGLPVSDSRVKLSPSSPSRIQNIYDFQPAVMPYIPSLDIPSTLGKSSSLTQEPWSSVESLYRSYRAKIVKPSSKEEKCYYPYTATSDLSLNREPNKTTDSEFEKDLLEEGERERFYRHMMQMYGNYHAQMVDFTKRTAVEMRIRRERMFGRRRRH
ncbi:uncharacterized protein [Drosophila bipectinata]|uniref:uncharacterized protein n=1 Tax=Drosophila bipectinata TaxID=42026 RepID=UPI001C8A605E|nr:uncharacterized protein LOC108130326 [Drosophila bipectinata]